MLTRLVVKNFQNHLAYTLDLDPHVTVLVGPNDAGKSALLRALKWVAMNRPNGTHFITVGENACQVKLFFDDHKITRDRSARVNEYRFDDKVFKAFGQGNVPEEIETALNLDDNNFQSQLAPPFWFALPPGLVSKELNRVVNLDVIDETLAAASVNVFRAKAHEQELQEQLEEARKCTEGLQWVEEAHAQYCTIEQLETDITQKRLECVRIDSVIGALERLTETVNASQNRSGAIRQRIDTLEQIVQCEQQLERLEQTISELQNRETTWQTAVTQRQKIDTRLNALTKDGCPLCGQKTPSSSSLRAIGT